MFLAIISGCSFPISNSKQLIKNKPIKIAESEGFVLWKVKDETIGGKVWIYYSTPNGHIMNY